MRPEFRERLQGHGRFLSALREFFGGRGYLEVDTPVLSPFLIPEPAIEVFRTEYLPARGEPRPMWLAPSPELWMKRLLAAGSGNIFQISRCFRNTDHGSPLHNPEFRLLEWYTEGAGYLESVALTEQLFEHLLSSVPAGPPASRLATPFAKLTMEEAFRSFAGIELSRCTEARDMATHARKAGLTLQGEPTWEEAFHIAFLSLVEPRLPTDRPLVLLDYPAQVPTTARRRPGTPWAERWELFVDGTEIANVYTEETDPQKLRALVAAESERRRAARTWHTVDGAFADLFRPDAPRCTGGALGVDRLEMVFGGQRSLEGVILFPFSAILSPPSVPI